MNSLIIFGLLYLIFASNIYFINSSIRKTRAVVWQSAVKWPEGIIPYYIDLEAFNGEEIIWILDAINSWNMETCVQFRLKQEKDKNWVKITDGINCHSSVGMDEKGEQELNLANPDCRYFGTILHELGHVVGLHHEHVRPIRDKYLQINTENIQEGLVKFYEMVQHSELDHFNLPYDLQSIMHYGSQAFTGNNGEPTINVKNQSMKYLLNEIYDKDISFLDVKVVNLHYKCAKKCFSKISCPSSGYIDQFCQCHTPESFEIRRCRDKNEKEWCSKKHKENQCELDFKFMSVNCRKTCNKCYKFKNILNTQPKGCKNINEDKLCDDWAERGECTKNAGYMKLKCERSCKYCIGNSTRIPCTNKYADDRCFLWAERGECHHNKNFMKINCAKSCKICKETCEDEFVICKEWAQMGRCESSPYTRNKCKMSCKTCASKIPECKNNHGDKSCNDWSKRGECQRNIKFMHFNCKKSCGLCPNPIKPTSTSRPVMETKYSINSSISSCLLRNKFHHCNLYKMAGDCLRNPEYMSVSCAKSCGNCLDMARKDFNASCRNVKSEKYCNKSLKNGECESKVHTMFKHCAKTCKFCFSNFTLSGCRNLENDSNCEKWSRNGNCSSHASFMMVHCAKTCFRCHKTLYKECKDIYNQHYCAVLKQIGKCHKNPKFMLINCAQTCGSCDLLSKNISNFICTNLFDNNLCLLWKNHGQCETNREFMMKNCGRTCGICQSFKDIPKNNTNCNDIMNEVECIKYKEQGKCKLKTPFVKEKCSKTCKSCPIKSKVCENLFNNRICANWTASGQCRKNYIFMKSMCPQSCGFCEILTCENLIDDNQCNKWVAEGKCQKNSEYMLTMCSNSCRNCTLYDQHRYKTKICIDTNKKSKCNNLKDARDCLVEGVITLKECAKTCGTCRKTLPICTDKMSSCIKPKRRGECKSNKKYMMENCQKTCGFCRYSINVTKSKSTIKKIVPIYKCENLYRDDFCGKWKSIGYCTKYPIFMSMQCRRACGKCHKTLECQNVYKNEICENWVTQGKCQTNIKMMSMLCMKSCGKCFLLRYEISDIDKCNNKYGEITCQALKAIGECERNLGFMLDKCAKACGDCKIKKRKDLKKVIKENNQCRNIYCDKLCEEWKESGQCERNLNYVTTVCARSCSNCTNFIDTKKKKCKNLEKNEKCYKMVKFGLCQKNPNLMNFKCSLSCGFCQKNIKESKKREIRPENKHHNKDCTNIPGEIQCSYWARQGFCQTNELYMTKYCRKSCNKCKITKQKPIYCIDNYNSFKCQIWAKSGECDRNKIWMMENCSKSCMVCQTPKLNTKNNLV